MSATPRRASARRVGASSPQRRPLTNATNQGAKRGASLKRPANVDQDVQALFSLERARTQESHSRDQEDRLAHVDKMRQLEEKLMEERQLANAQRPSPRKRGVPEDEVAEMRAEFRDEFRRLQAELHAERCAVRGLKVRLWLL